MSSSFYLMDKNLYELSYHGNVDRDEMLPSLIIRLVLTLINVHFHQK